MKILRAPHIEPCEDLNTSVNPPNFTRFCFKVVHTVLQRVLANAVAPSNMWFMFVTRETCHFDRSWLNVLAPANMSSIMFTLDTSHLDMSQLKDSANWKVFFMFVTDPVFHLDKS